MQEVYDFLKNSHIYYLATLNGGASSVRPFSTIDIFEEKLYILTKKSKDVFKQMQENKQIEICACENDENWIRITANVVVDDRVEAKTHVLENNPHMEKKFKVDEETQVLYLENIIVKFYKVDEIVNEISI